MRNGTKIHKKLKFGNVNFQELLENIENIEEFKIIKMEKFEKYTLCYRQKHFSFNFQCEYNFNSVQECDKRLKELRLPAQTVLLSSIQIQKFWEPLFIHKFLVSRNLKNYFHFKICEFPKKNTVQK